MSLSAYRGRQSAADVRIVFVRLFYRQNITMRVFAM